MLGKITLTARGDNPNLLMLRVKTSQKQSWKWPHHNLTYAIHPNGVELG